jgi:hypothetical protein
VDTSDPGKVLTVEGRSVSAGAVERHVANAGFQVLGQIGEESPAANGEKSFIATYRPLLLVFAYLIGLVALFEALTGSVDWMRAMGRFMGGFFVAFSFFKLLDLRGFVDSFQTYDILARRSRAFGYSYPFVELTLGVAYLAGIQPVLTNVVTLLVMLVGLVGVSQALLQKRRIKCACLGTVFNLPMSKVTLLEDTLMAGMAAAALVDILS